MIRENLVNAILALVKKYYPEESSTIKEMPSGYLEIKFLKYSIEVLENGWINILGPNIYWRLEIYDYKSQSELEQSFLLKLEEFLASYEANKNQPIPDTAPLFNKLWNSLKKGIKIGGN